MRHAYIKDDVETLNIVVCNVLCFLISLHCCISDESETLVANHKHQPF